MKNILIPIDFSNNSKNALSYARILLEKEICNFIIAHVYISKPAAMLSKERNDAILDQLSDDSEAQIVTFVKTVIEENTNPNHQFKAIAAHDTLVQSIKHICSSKSIDYIIMGTKGAKGAKEVFMGSNTVKVINSDIHIPILAVPQNFVPQKPDSVAFSTNFKRPFYENELSGLLQLCKNLNLRINIISIIEDAYLTQNQSSNKEELKHIFKDITHSFTKIDVENSETEALRNYTKQTQNSLLALIDHKQNFFQKLLEENVVDKISFNSPIPILILPEIT